MTNTKQCSVWAVSVNSDQKKYETDEDEQTEDQCSRRIGALQKCCCSCCPCSTPLLIGFLIGALIAGVALATILSIYLVGSGKKTNNSTTTAAPITGTITTATTTTATTTTATTSTSATFSTTTTSTSTRTSTTTSSSSTISTTTATTSTATTATTSTTTTSTTTTSTSATTTTTTTTTTTAPYCTTRVTFDDIPGQSSTSGIVPNGYQNLNWTNVEYLNASTMPLSGYETAVSSPPYVAYSPTGSAITIRSANSTRFAFNSIVLAAAWRDTLEWQFFVSFGGAPLYAGSFYLNPLNQTIVTCSSCSNLDAIYFQTLNGTAHPGLAGNGTQLGFDDLCISFGY